MHPSPYRLPLTRARIDSYHTMRCQSVIKPIICGLHPMIILQKNSFVFKAFLMLHFNDHLYSKSCVFLWVANFQGLTSGFASLPTLSRAFTVGHICITKTNEAFNRGGVYPYLLIPNRFSFSCIQPCDLVARCPTVPSLPNQTPNTMHDYNHALTPISCNFPMHMQCDVSFHAYTMSHI